MIEQNNLLLNSIVWKQFLEYYQLLWLRNYIQVARSKLKIDPTDVDRIEKILKRTKNKELVKSGSVNNELFKYSLQSIQYMFLNF